MTILRHQGHNCWHTHEAYNFPHEAGVVVHEDNWHWGPHESVLSASTTVGAIGTAANGWRGNKLARRETGGRDFAASIAGEVLAREWPRCLCGGSR
jgi:hypothetical protein